MLAAATLSAIPKTVRLVTTDMASADELSTMKKAAAINEISMIATRPNDPVEAVAVTNALLMAGNCSVWLHYRTKGLTK